MSDKKNDSSDFSLDASDADANQRSNSIEMSDPATQFHVRGNMEGSGSGQTTPVRARTMKEYDQQVTSLQKENFNLKLRIYFLEENARKRFGDSKDDVYQLNIELKVEVESLRKELQDKDVLLKKASSALDSLSTNHEAEVRAVRERLEYGWKSEVERLREELSLLKELFNNKEKEMERANESLLKANERISELVHIKEQLSKEKDKVIEDAKEMSKQKLELDLIDFSLSEKNSLILEEQVAEYEDELDKKNKLIEQLRCALKVKDVLIEQVESEKNEVESKFKDISRMKGSDDESLTRHTCNTSEEDIADLKVNEECQDEDKLMIINRNCSDHREKLMLENYVEKLSNHLKEREGAIRKNEKTIKGLEDKCFSLLQIIEELKDGKNEENADDYEDYDGAYDQHSEGLKSSWSHLYKGEDEAREEDSERDSDSRDFNDISHLQFKDVGRMTYGDHSLDSSRQSSANNPNHLNVFKVARKSKRLEKENMNLKDRLWTIEQQFHEWKSDEKAIHLEKQRMLKDELEKTIEAKDNLEEQCSELEEELFRIKKHFDEFGSFIVDFDAAPQDSHNDSAVSQSTPDFMDRLTGLREVFVKQEKLLKDRQEDISALQAKNVEYQEALVKQMEDSDELRKLMEEKIKSLNDEDKVKSTFLAELDKLKLELLEKDKELQEANSLSKFEKDSLISRCKEIEAINLQLNDNLIETKLANEALLKKLSTSDALGQQLNSLLKEGGEITRQLNTKAEHLSQTNEDLLLKLERKSSSLSAYDEEIKDLKKKITEKELMIDCLNTELADSKNLSSDLEKKLADHNNLITSYECRISRQEILIKELNEKLSNMCLDLRSMTQDNSEMKSSKFLQQLDGMSSMELEKMFHKKEQLLDLMHKKRSSAIKFSERDDLVGQWSELVCNIEKEWRRELKEIKVLEDKWHVMLIEHQALMNEKSLIESKMEREINKRDAVIKDLKVNFALLVSELNLGGAPQLTADLGNKTSKRNLEGLESISGGLGIASEAEVEVVSRGYTGPGEQPARSKFVALKSFHDTDSMDNSDDPARKAIDRYRSYGSSQASHEEFKTLHLTSTNTSLPLHLESRFENKMNHEDSNESEEACQLRASLSVALNQLDNACQKIRNETFEKPELIELLESMKSSLLEIAAIRQLKKDAGQQIHSICQGSILNRLENEVSIKQKDVDKSSSFGGNNSQLVDTNSLKSKMLEIQKELDNANDVIHHLKEQIKLNTEASEVSGKMKFNPELIVRLVGKINTLKQQMQTDNKLSTEDGIPSKGTKQPENSKSPILRDGGSHLGRPSVLGSESARGSMASSLDVASMTPLIETRLKNTRAFEKLREEISHLRQNFRYRLGRSNRPSFGRLSELYIGSQIAGSSFPIGSNRATADESLRELDFSRSSLVPDFDSTHLDESHFTEGRLDLMSLEGREIFLSDMLAESEGRCRIMRDRLEELLVFLRSLLEARKDKSTLPDEEVSKMSECLNETVGLLENVSRWFEEQDGIMDASLNIEGANQMTRFSLVGQTSLLIGRTSLAQVAELDEDAGEKCSNMLERTGKDETKSVKEDKETSSSDLSQASQIVKESGFLSKESSELHDQLQSSESIIKDLKSQLSAYQERCDALTEKLIDAEKMRENLEVELDGLRRTCNENYAVDADQKLTEFNLQISTIKQEISLRDDKIAELLKIQKLMEQSQLDMTLEIESLRQCTAQVQKENESLKFQNDALAETVVHSESLIPGFQKQVDELKRTNGELTKDLDRSKRKESQMTQLEKTIIEKEDEISQKKVLISYLTEQVETLKDELQEAKETDGETISQLELEIEKIQFDLTIARNDSDSKGSRLDSMTEALERSRDSSLKLEGRCQSLASDLEQLHVQVNSLERELQEKLRKLVEAERRVVEFQSRYEDLQHKFDVLQLEKDSLEKLLIAERQAINSALSGGTISVNRNSSSHPDKAKSDSLLTSPVEVLSNLETFQKKESKQAVNFEPDDQIQSLHYLSSPKSSSCSGCILLRDELTLLIEERDALSRKVIELSSKGSILTYEVISAHGNSKYHSSFGREAACGNVKCQEKINYLESYIRELKEIIDRNEKAASEMRDQIHRMNVEIKQKKLIISKLDSKCLELQSSLKEITLHTDQKSVAEAWSHGTTTLNEYRRLVDTLKIEINILKERQASGASPPDAEAVLPEVSDDKENLKLGDPRTKSLSEDVGVQDSAFQVELVRKELERLVVSNANLRNQLEGISNNSAEGTSCDHSGFIKEIERLKRQVVDLKQLPGNGQPPAKKDSVHTIKNKINPSAVIEQINKTRKVLAQTTLNLDLARHAEKSEPGTAPSNTQNANLP